MKIPKHFSSFKRLLSLIIILIFFADPGKMYAQRKNSQKPFTFKGKIVFQRDSEKGINIYVLDGKTGWTKQLTTFSANIDPKWSPDGKEIAFASIREGGWDIYRMNSDGKNIIREVHTKDGFSREPRWSSDGKEIYFFSNIRANLQENSVTLETGKVKTLFSTGNLMANFNDGGALGLTKAYEKLYTIIPAPDNQYRILYYAHERDNPLVLLNTKTNTKTILKKTGEPAWSKDSQQIAYFSDWSTLVIYNVNNKQSEKISIHGGENEFCGNPSWSKNAHKIVYYCGPETGPGESWLYILDVRTGKSIKLIKGQEPDWF